MPNNTITVTLTLQDQVDGEEAVEDFDRAKLLANDVFERARFFRFVYAEPGRLLKAILHGS